MRHHDARRRRASLMRWRRRRTPTEAPALAPPAAPRPPAALPVPDLTELADQARYHRDRLALYRAKMHGPKATSVGRLEELERAATTAEERLAAARRRARR